MIGEMWYNVKDCGIKTGTGKWGAECRKSVSDGFETVCLMHKCPGLEIV